MLFLQLQIYGHHTSILIPGFVQVQNRAGAGHRDQGNPSSDRGEVVLLVNCCILKAGPSDESCGLNGQDPPLLTLQAIQTTHDWPAT